MRKLNGSHPGFKSVKKLAGPHPGFQAFTSPKMKPVPKKGKKA